jgi:hypothetical protein
VGFGARNLEHEAISVNIGQVERGRSGTDGFQMLKCIT